MILRTKYIRPLVAGVALAVVGAVVPGSAAFANPAGCSKHVISFGQNGSGELVASLGGSCSGGVTRILHGEIKHDLTLRPDPVVTGGTDSDTTTFLVNLQDCDNRNTATYYARTFFDGFSDYTDSAHKKFTVC